LAPLVLPVLLGLLVWVVASEAQAVLQVLPV
jgi:hypothetical protein